MSSPPHPPFPLASALQMEDNQVKVVDDLQPSGAGSQLPYMKVEDTQYFAKLLVSLSLPKHV